MLVDDILSALPAREGHFVTESGVDFYFAEPAPRRGSGQVHAEPGSGLFRAEYRLPEGLKASVRGARVALVDDMISAGSSVRATASALADAAASVAVVGTLLTLGSVGLDHFAEAGVPVEALGRGDFAMWTPDACPLCQTGTPLQRRT